jgi:hypothetical protein
MGGSPAPLFVDVMSVLIHTSEYPGAPDRGGKKEDTANYVLLMQTLRKTFDSSGGEYGLTFTAPSSYWYLKWFDLPGLLKHVDWVNLMSYVNTLAKVVGRMLTDRSQIRLARRMGLFQSYRFQGSRSHQFDRD